MVNKTALDYVNVFCGMMNKKALEIGMNSSNFVDPAGCKNISTTRDMLMCLVNLCKYEVAYNVMTKVKYSFMTVGDCQREITVESKTLSGVGTDCLTNYYDVLFGKGGTLTYQKQYNSAVVVNFPEVQKRYGCVTMGAFETNDLPNNRFAADKEALDIALGKAGNDICARSGIVCKLPDISDEKIEILYEKNADEVAPPASMSKMLTMQVVLDHVENLDDSVLITEEMINTVPTGFYQKYVRAGDNVKIIDLLHTLMLASNNAAGFVLAYYVGKKLYDESK